MSSVLNHMHAFNFQYLVVSYTETVQYICYVNLFCMLHVSFLIVGEALSYELSKYDVKLILSARSEDKLVALRDKLKTPENVRYVCSHATKPITYM